MTKKTNTRRKFLKLSALAGAGTVLSTGISKPLLAGTSVLGEDIPSKANEPIIDIHQHIFYHGRIDEQLLHHQKAMGVTKTVLLPAGVPAGGMPAHFSYSNGLPSYSFAQEHPESFLFAANEVPDLPDATKHIEKYLKLGAKMIAEMKYDVACDSPGMQKLYQLAADYDVPILMHWKYETYNLGFPRFYKMLEKYPKTKFIGHAQTWWANIDKKQQDHPWELYPKGPVTPVGLTDHYLSDYPNMYGGLAAGSGLNAFTRDEDFTKDFFERHQDKLLFGSDCADSIGEGNACIGSQTIAVVRKLTSGEIRRKLLYENAKKLLRL